MDELTQEQLELMQAFERYVEWYNDVDELSICSDPEATHE